MASDDGFPPGKAEPPPGPPAAPSASGFSLFSGFKHKTIYRVVLGYAVGAWSILQVAAIVLPGMGLPNWTLRIVIVALLLGFGVAGLVGWMLDRRAAGQRLLPRRLGRRLAFLVVALLPAAATAAFFLSRPLPTARPLAQARPPSPHLTPASSIPPAETAPLVSDKSIAVLPFENRSDDKANGYFTDGVQDEILTDLAKVADLKVISRTSVMQYRDHAARNLRDIAAQLGVAHVVEGSVQRAGNEVHVNAQLINARTNTHEWAMSYDKTLDNVFTVQTEVAQAIAEQLRARISPEEHVAMTRVPTKDALALQLYQQAQELESRTADSDARDGLLQAVGLLEQAVQRDPNFLRAYGLLCRVQMDIYWEDFDHGEARREAGRAALAQAVRLGPDAGDTLLTYAQRIAALETEAARAMRELRGLARGRLALGASTTIGSYLLPAVLGAFRRRHPAVELSLTIGNTADITQRLLDRTLDLGLTEGAPPDEPAFQARVFSADDLIVIAAPSHLFAAGRAPGPGKKQARLKSVTSRQLCAQPLVLREPGSGTRAVLDRALTAVGAQASNVALTLSSTEAIKRAVAAGLGLAVVSRLSVTLELAGGILVEIPTRGLRLRRPLHEVTLRDRQLSASAQAFCALLTRVAPR